MKTLIVEDDFASRLLLQELLKEYGSSHIAVNGVEALDVFKKTIAFGDRYNLVCLDIMMPVMDGRTTLKHIRNLEEAADIPYSERAKIVMTTALDDVKSIMGSFHELCDGYIVKPFTRDTLVDELRKLKLIN